METLTQPPPPGELVRLNPQLFNPALPIKPNPPALHSQRVWCIAWERIQGGPGRGKGTHKFNRAEADELCASLNRDYKHIQHRVELA